MVGQDNVRKSFAGSFFADDIEERLADLLDMTKWREFVLADVRWSVVGCHPEALAPAEWRRLMRQDLERIRMAPTRALAYADKMGCDLAENECGYDFRQRQGDAKVEIDMAAFTEEVLRSAFVASIPELNNAKSSIKTLEKYLETLSKAA